jgi:hypothetical protein
MSAEDVRKDRRRKEFAQKLEKELSERRGEYVLCPRPGPR